MTESIIKNFTIIISSFYIFAKLLNLKITTKIIILDLVFALFLSFLAYFIRIYYLPLTTPVLIVLFLIYIELTLKTEVGLATTTTILSFGISFVFFTISAFFTAVVFRLLGARFSDDLNRNSMLYILCVAFLQLIFISVPFRFRRLKSGMPFLLSTGSSNWGVFLSVFLLCSIMIMSSDKNIELIYILPAILVLLSGILILFWWRNRLSKTYLEKLRLSEIQDLQNTIDQKEAQIKQFEQHNDLLAKIIHKDNKLIPAMELAVREYLQSFTQGDTDNIRETGQLLLNHLETVSHERSGIIEEYQFSSKKLPLTGVISIDALMTYMLNKARENCIEFELVISGSVKYLVGNIILESDLNTLLADLIENAIIATKYGENRKILVSLGICEDCYLIDVFDSGIPFDAETIVNLGLKKFTTHNDGSGIGLTTAFEIFKKYGASFLIEEFDSENTLFTKKVSVKFDKLNKYIAKTLRNPEIEAISQRDDLILMI